MIDESSENLNFAQPTLNEFQLNLRDVAVGICKRFNNQEVLVVHLVSAIIQSVLELDFDSTSHKLVIESALGSLPNSSDGVHELSSEFSSALMTITDTEQASNYVKAWFSMSENLALDVEAESEAVEETIVANDITQADSLMTKSDSQFSGGEATDDLIDSITSNQVETTMVTAEELLAASTVENRIVEMLNRQRELSERQSELITQDRELSDEIDRHETDLEDLRGIQEDLDQWRSERERSFAWKLVSALNSRKTQLESDEEKLTNFVSKDLEIDPEFSIKTRKWIVKNVVRNFLVTNSLFLFIWWVFSNYRSVLSFLESIQEMRVLGAIAAFVLLILSNLSGPNLFGIVSAISLLSFIALLFSYSRKISRYSQQLYEQSELTRTMEKATDHVVESRARINSLYPQVPQLLEFYSLVLHDPLRIDDKYREFSATFPDTSQIPESLELAAPTDESIARVFEELVLRALSQEIQTLGWRSEALRIALGRIAESMGMGVASEALTTVDKDQRRSGIRQLIIDQPESDREPVLKAIGDERVKLLAKAVQERVLPQTQPNVKSLRPDPLGHLELSDEIGAGRQVQVSSWQEKLVEAAGVGFPWSAGNFSNIGKANGKHLEPIESYFISSKQVSELSHPELKRHPQVDPGARPFEVSIRVDLSAWCKPGDLAIFDGLEASTKEESQAAEFVVLAEQSDSDLVY